MAASASSQIYIVRDDGGGKNISLGGGQWSSATANTWFGGGIVWPDFADQHTTATMSFAFQGTSVALWGTTPQDPNSQNFQASFDGNSLYNTSTTDTTPQTYMQWYQTPSLPEGQHNLTLTGLTGEGVDFLLITPGQHTSVTGEILMIDDTHPSIQYQGTGWKNAQGTRFQGDGLAVLPFMNGTHQTTNVGDSFTLSFIGTNLKVFGIVPSQSSSLSLSYTVDNSTSASKNQTFTASSSTTDAWNSLLLDTGTLSAGNHTLTVTLISIGGTPLIVDYALYAPSFSSLADMARAASPSGTSSASTPSSSNSSSPSSIGAASQSKLRVGTVAGAAIGGVLGLCLLTALFLFIRKRRRSQDDTSDRWVAIDDANIRGPNRLSRYHVEAFQANRLSRWNTDATTLIGYGAGLGKQPSKGRSEKDRDSPTLPTSPLPQNVTFTTATAPVAQRRVDIQQRIADLQAQVAQLEAEQMTPSSSLGSMASRSSYPYKYSYESGGFIKSPPLLRQNNTQLENLKRDITALEEEYKRLANEASPLASRGDFVR